MTSSRSLVDRLRSPSTSSESQGGHSLDELRKSVCNNLERILNSRAGMAPACSSYGLPDFSQIVNGVPARARDIEDSLRRCIAEYEPRIRHIEVQHVPDAHGPMTACFRIRASVVGGKNAEEIWFETVVVSSGRVRLK